MSIDNCIGSFGVACYRLILMQIILKRAVNSSYCHVEVMKAWLFRAVLTSVLMVEKSILGLV